MEYKIGEIECSKLAKAFKTPLYVYDENYIRGIMKAYKNNLVSNKFDTQILFASKAFSICEMYKIALEEGLGCDTVSGGELYVALTGGMNPENIYFHGNNKTYEEVVFAINNKVINFVVDSLDEMILLESICEELQANVNVLFRLNVGVEAHTHKFIVTGHVDSKFGMQINGDDVAKCIGMARSSKYITFKGFHSHIGSQIFEMDAFYAEIDKLIDYAKTVEDNLIINIGGGFGCRYTDEDHPIEISELSKMLINHIEKSLEEKNYHMSKLIIEPGRSIVGEAGYTLYTIGNMKKTPNKKYYFIDGGMADNIRPALYQAKYDCLISNRLGEEATEEVCIAGKCCESGDIIIERTMLPKASRGDILCVKTTGAYGYSMSSHYNQNPTPAVVFVNGSKARVVVKREEYKDLVKNNIEGDWLEF